MSFFRFHSKIPYKIKCKNFILFISVYFEELRDLKLVIKKLFYTPFLCDSQKNVECR